VRLSHGPILPPDGVAHGPILPPEGGGAR
jgi:hypothetical protein